MKAKIDIIGKPRIVFPHGFQLLQHLQQNGVVLLHFVYIVHKLQSRDRNSHSQFLANVEAAITEVAVQVLRV